MEDSGEPARLAIGDAVALALVSNADARVLRLEANAVEMGASYAGSWNDPTLSGELRRAVGGSSTWFVAAGLSFTIPLSGVAARQRDFALARASVAELRALSYEQDLAEAVHIAWLDWSRAKEREELLGEYHETLAHVVEVARRLAEAGELPLAEQGVIPIEHARAEVEHDAARLAVERARLGVLTLLGLAPEANVELVASLDPQLDPGAAPRDWPETHLRVQLALAGLDAAAQRARLAAALGGPDVTIGPTFELDDGQASVGVALSLPIPSFNGNRAELAERRGERTAARARAEMVAQAMVAEQRGAVVSLEAHAERLRKLRALQARVDEQVAAVQRLSERGELEPLLFRHALRSSLETRLALLDAERDAAASRVSLFALYRRWSAAPRSQGENR